jgi:hypothetical protein
MYDDFALYCVSKFYIRFSNKQEAPVKSVVNYLKTVIEPWKAEYIREFCGGNADMNVADFNVSDFSEYLVDIASEQDYNTYDYLCFKSADVVRAHLRKIPRKHNSAEWTNIYISCLLTLIDQMTLTSKQVRAVRAAGNENIYLDIIKENLNKAPILYHLEDTWEDYIRVIVREVRHLLSAQMHWKSGSHYTAEAAIKAVVMESILEDEENGC